MKTTERFNRAYDALVKAFFEGTLAKGDCAACAVGNMINASRPFTSEERERLQYHEAGWVTVFCTINGHRKEYNPKAYLGEAKSQIDATGYTPKELAKVEHVFETTCIYNHNYARISEQEILEDQFNGLCAVVDVLLKLDGISPDEKYNARFREHPKLITHDH
jgi:hypothetical protein